MTRVAVGQAIAPMGTTAHNSRIMAKVARFAVFSSLLLALACGGGSGPSASPTPQGTPSAASGRWLTTSGNRILASDGTQWMGRGVNIHDTRSCNACTFEGPNVGEVKRRIDEAVGAWGSTFLRLDLESYASADGRTHWRGVLDDAAYLADVKSIVDYVGTKPGVYVLVSLWVDPTLDGLGWPTADTSRVWQKLADTFKNDAHVLFGVANEPQLNFDGALDGSVWTAMNTVVASIRATEDAAHTPHHLIAVQGTRSWARVLDYYLDHPITAGGGGNIVYETHPYDSSGAFQARFIGPSQKLPVIIGEFGPVSGNMTEEDTLQLMVQADSLQVPYLAWNFHMRCSPDLLVDNSGGGCGIGMPLQPTSWGAKIRDHLLSVKR
jgi:Cellulase (glycosyl hydrolase family 5)